MRKATKLYVLLGVLLVVCAAAFLVSRREEKKEEIKTGGETVLSIQTADVTALSWTNEEGTYSFTKGEDGWTYDADAAFPVDTEKVESMLEQFENFSAAFIIENVTDYSQYGLSDPVCTITVTAGEESTTVSLGEVSKMDEQRYVSLGDGNAYLATHDPLEEYDAVLRDMILDDTVPEFDTAEKIVFTGAESYTVTREEDTESLSAEDVYFTDGKALDTSNVKSLVSSLQSLSLNNYISYNATEEELNAYGLADPAQTIAVDYVSEDKDGTVTDSGTFTLSLGQNAEEKAAYDEAVQKEEEDLPEVTCYARVGDSQILYKITESEYEALTAVSYNDLRHQKIFAGDFDAVTSIDVTLDGETYTFTCTPAEKDDEDAVWSDQEEEIDIADLQSAITALSATEFTEEQPSGQEEISLTLHLDNEAYPTVSITLTRYDGTSCLASVDGASTAFVTRTQTVSLEEAVNALTLGK